MLCEKFFNALREEQDEDINQLKQLLIDYNSNFKHLERIGFMTRNLSIDSLKTGPNGNILVKLLFDKNKLNSNFSFKIGDIIILSRGSNNLKECLNKLQLQGNVYKQNKDSVTILLENDMANDGMPLEENISYFVVKTINEITYKRMFKTLNLLEKLEQDNDNVSSSKNISNPLLLQILFNKIDKTVLKQQLKYDNLPDLKLVDQNLNKSQIEAVNFALHNPISIIHGPFACGKTSTVVEILEQVNKSSEHKGKVLICGPSNISVDTILEKIDKNGNLKPGQMIRIGNPTRINNNAKYSIDNIANSGDNVQICNDIKNEINTMLKPTSSSGKNKKNGSSKLAKNKPAFIRGGKWSEIKTLRKELVVRENKIIKELIKNSKFIFATLHGSSNRQVLTMYDENDDPLNSIETLIIDEVSQSLEIQCWIPILTHLKYLKRIIFAGDNKQLPPTIKCGSDTKTKKSFQILNKTIFDRLEENFGDIFIKFLNTQYRMNEKIMEFPSAEMYGGRVISGEINRNILLSDLASNDGEILDINEDDFINEPLIWYDTQCDLNFMEDKPDEGVLVSKNAIFNSKSNKSEVYIALQHVKRLIDELKLKEEHIGIITPYQAQVILMKEVINEEYPGIEIHTVDGYQGNEKECIILSLVRFNEENELGFVKDERRLNVAMTRAKRQLCVIGNLEMLAVSKQTNQFLKNWCKFIDAKAIIEYPEL